MPEEASQPSSTTHTSAQSSTISDTEVKSADPISDEPIVAVITEEESSVTGREISPNQAPTETSTGIISIDPRLLVFPHLFISHTIRQRLLLTVVV